MSDQPASHRGVANGVPYLMTSPADSSDASAPVVLGWHPMDPPRSESAFAAAISLDGLDAWKIYFGLPMMGSRLPDGGFDALMQLGFEDAVLKMLSPIVEQGAREFPEAFRALQAELGFSGQHIGLFGGSIGSAVAQLIMTETGSLMDTSIEAAVLISPVTQLHATVEANGRRFGVEYEWGEESLEVADRFDFVKRADGLALAGQPAIQLIVGAEDDYEGFIEPARRMRVALTERYDDPARVDLIEVPGMEHAFADEPGLEPQPQSEVARTVDRHAAAWFRTHLRADGEDRR